jgi:hypothetical protein
MIFEAAALKLPAEEITRGKRAEKAIHFNQTIHH